MAIGDAKASISSVTNTSFLDIKPVGANDEWILHNTYYSGKVEFYISDGVNNLKFEADSSVVGGARIGYTFHLKNNYYLRIKNISGSTILIAYDGIRTKGV